MRNTYPSDRSREQFAFIQVLWEQAKKKTTPRVADLYHYYPGKLSNRFHGGAQGSEGAKATSGVRRPSCRRRAERLVGVRRVSAVGDEMPGHATRRQVIAGVLVRAECAPGRTRAAEGNDRRPIFCARNRTDPISGFAKNGAAPVVMGICSIAYGFHSSNQQS